MIVRRLWALAALVLLAASVALAVGLAVDRFPRGLTVIACLVLALFAGRKAFVTGGFRRHFSLAVAIAAALGAVVVSVLEGRPLLNALVVVLFALAVVAARNAFRVHVQLPAAG